MLYSALLKKHQLEIAGGTRMRLLASVLILSLTVLFVIACGDSGTETSTVRPTNSPAASAPTATPDELASARINFQKNCVNCHGAKGEGGPKEVDGKKFRVPALREGHALKHTDEKFVVQITEGDEEMPAFKDKLTAAEITDLVKFIRKELQGK
jgi:mono/diheme cytochrome c family protein